MAQLIFGHQPAFQSEWVVYEHNNVDFYMKQIELWLFSMHYFVFTYGLLSKYGDGCDWECNDGGAQIILTGGIMTGGVEDELLSACCCCFCWFWHRSRCWLDKAVTFAFVVVGLCWITPVVAVVTLVALVGVKHRFLELALLGLFSNVLGEDALPPTISVVIINRKIIWI